MAAMVVAEVHTLTPGVEVEADIDAYILHTYANPWTYYRVITNMPSGIVL